MLSLAFSFLRIEAQHIAFASLAITDPDFLDLQIVGNLAIATGAAQHLNLDVLHPTHRHRQNEAAQTSAQLDEVLGGVHRGITDEQAAAELPGMQVLLDARDTSEPACRHA